MDFSNLNVLHSLEPGQLEQELKPIIIPSLGGLLIVLILAQIVGKFLDSA